jgi:hypothetical protein
VKARRGACGAAEDLSGARLGHSNVAHGFAIPFPPRGISPPLNRCGATAADGRKDHDWPESRFPIRQRYGREKVEQGEHADRREDRCVSWIEFRSLAAQIGLLFCLSVIFGVRLNLFAAYHDRTPIEQRATTRSAYIGLTSRHCRAVSQFPECWRRPSGFQAGLVVRSIHLGLFWSLTPGASQQRLESGPCTCNAQR